MFNGAAKGVKERIHSGEAHVGGLPSVEGRSDPGTRGVGRGPGAGVAR